MRHLSWWDRLLHRKPRYQASTLMDLEKELQVEQAQVGAYELQAAVAEVHPDLDISIVELAKQQAREHAEKVDYLSLQRELLLQDVQREVR